MSTNLMTDTHNTGRPCRICDSNAPHVLVSVLGNVDTPMSQGRYHPASDEYIGNDNSPIAGYFRNSLGYVNYKPLNRGEFPSAPSGWCSWGYYGRSITQDEVLANARWMAGNLKEFGLDLVLIDDGWQGSNRDWFGLRELFPHGMKWLSEEIAKLGMMPGIWLCPHGTDNEAEVKKWQCFLFNTDGKSTCSTMGGPFTWDPTHPNAREYMHRLISMLVDDWGYRYLKLDGIHSITLGYGASAAYKAYRSRFFDPSISGESAFRRSLEIVKEAAGEKTCISGCGMFCPEAIGLIHASRTGNDTDAEWRGFLNAVQSTHRGYHLHNSAWYSDPDYILLRSPLTLEMARAWVSLLGLTGQQLYLGDRLPDLGPERVALIKKIAPPAPIDPFDLFPARRQKSVIDLKVNHLGRAYDVVGLFNYSETSSKGMQLRFADLGLSSTDCYHAFDFWSCESLGVCRGGIFTELPPASCRVITLIKEEAYPLLLSTSRHITQGWTDVESLTGSGTSAVIHGRSSVIAGQEYILTFGLPQSGPQAFTLSSFDLSGPEPIGLHEGRSSARVSWTPRTTGAVSWTATFAHQRRGRPLPELTSYPYMLGSRDLDPWTVHLWWASFGSPTSFVVKQDGVLLGHVFGTRCTVGNLKPGHRHVFEIGVADLDGRSAVRHGSITVTVGETLPPSMPLSDLPWVEAHSDYLFVRADQSVSSAGLACAGRKYAKGIGTCVNSRVVYDLDGAFGRLHGSVGIEDQNGAPADLPPSRRGIASFRILADGREALAPTVMVHGQAAVPFSIDLRGVKQLELLAELPGGLADQPIAPHANWLGMELDLALSAGRS
jgi:hypothetical protein